VERLRLALESERKLRKRVEVLAGKVAEAAKEVEAARNSELATSNALTRIKGERDALDRRLQALQRKQATLDAATTAAIAELEPLSAMKRRVFDLEEEVGQLRLKCESELPGVIMRAKSEAAEERKRAEASAADAADARARLQELSSKLGHVLSAGVGAGAGAGGATTAADRLRADEDRYVTEGALRDKLADARGHIAALEAAVLGKDSTIMELQLEVEAHRQSVDRHKRRLAEVTAFSTIAGRGAGAAPGSGGSSGGEAATGAAAGMRAAGGGAAAASGAGGSRREAELEELVTALRRVTEKQKADMDKLRRQLTSARAAATTTTTAAAPGAAVPAPAAAPPSDGGGAGGGGGVAAAGLRARIAQLEAELRAAGNEAKRLRERAEAAERTAATAASAPPPSAMAPSTAGSDAGEVARLRNEVSRLATENVSLREELSAFDLSFFEEIEDLKWRYAEAATKCRAFDEYVKMYPPRGASVGGGAGAGAASGGSA